MLFWAAFALAHEVGLSYARVSPEELRITVAEAELAGAARLEGDLQASRVLIAEFVLAGSSVTVNGEACELDEPLVQRVEEDGVELAVPLACPSGPMVYTAGLFDRVGTSHRQTVEVDGEAIAVLDASARSAQLAGRPGAFEVAGRFFGLGVEHIVYGYDHLLFLFGLLLAATSLRSMLLVVTGFTVAHSVTLSAAALDLVRLPSREVELAIAASIVFVGVENFWSPPPGRRAVVTCLLGLIHGFGFASMLGALGIPRGQALTALLAFNGGVEVGQGLLVLLALPVLLWLRRRAWWEQRAVPALSVLVALAGGYWFVERW